MLDAAFHSVHQWKQDESRRLHGRQRELNQSENMAQNYRGDKRYQTIYQRRRHSSSLRDMEAAELQQRVTP